jgi:hypothetical protein
MGKAKSDENDDTTTEDRRGDDDDERAETEEESDSDSGSDLRPAKSKIGESKDNLRKRSDYFQRRR